MTGRGPDPWAQNGPAGPLVIAALLLVGTALLVSPLADGLLPSGAVALLRRNSEAWVGLALLVLDLWLLPRDRRDPGWRWWWVALATTGVLMLMGRPIGLPGALVTLNEPFLAAAVLSAWLRRPGRGVSPDAGTALAGVGLILLVAVGVATDGAGIGAPIVQQAETIGLLAVGMLVADVLYPWGPGQPTSDVAPRWIRISVIVVLLILPVVGDGGEGGPAVPEDLARFVGRMTEAVIVGVLLAALAELALVRSSVRRAHPAIDR